MFRNRLTELLDLAVPIFQAPMAGGGDTAELVAASSNAGALGCFGAAYLTPEQIVERGKQIRDKTSRPFLVNLFAPTPRHNVSAESIERSLKAVARFYKELGIEPPTSSSIISMAAPVVSPAPSFDDQLAAAVDTGARAVSFTFGQLPPAAVREIKQRKMLLFGTATTVGEAKSLEDGGVDAVIAQGSESGGHRGTFATTFSAGMVGGISLIPQMADAIKIPVIASGGIMDGRGIVAALALGASAVQMGTAFLTCVESGVSEGYRKAICDAAEDETQITRAFSGRPARGIVNRFLDEMEKQEDAILPFPLQNAVTRPMRNESARQDNSEYLSLWAGQGVRLARRTSTAELIMRLTEEIRTAIARLSD
jgi:Dioxygenases related to 2-nitropropane dioxygenase